MSVKKNDDTLPLTVHMGEIRPASEFRAPETCRTLAERRLKLVQWLRAKELDDSKLPVMKSSNWEPELVDMTKKGLPVYPLIRHIDGVGYVVFVTPKFNLRSKLRRLIYGLPEEIQPYWVRSDGSQLNPIFDLSWRGSYEIKAAAVELLRTVEGKLRFDTNVAGRHESYEYSYVVKATIGSPVRFVEFCKNNTDARAQFNTEIETMLNEIVSQEFYNNGWQPNISTRGSFNNEFFIGMGIMRVEFYLKYKC